jgi:molybdate transport system regulatory protein
MSDKNIQPLVKVVLTITEGEEKLFCGPGMIAMLEAIHQTGSVRHASAYTSISYSKAWKLLQSLEKWLGFPVTIRQPGGVGGGKTLVTDEGLNFIKKHRDFLRDCQNAVESLCTQYYG